jgi:hypothetical protein
VGLTGTGGGAAPRERWILEALRHWGAVPEGGANGLIAFTLSGDLASFLRRGRVVLTFQKRLAAQGKAELASPGSWLHDQVLRFCRERGSVAEAYLPPRASLDVEAVVRLRRRGVVAVGEAQERRYGTVFLFTFRVSYYSDPAEEEILHVGVDAERRRVFQRAASRLLDAMENEPREGYSPPVSADVRAAFLLAWQAVEGEVEERVHALTEAGRVAYLRRIQTVETYYRQLLDEENRLYKSRSSRRGQEESRDRIDLLKLEWERRVKEESERLRPQVVVLLSAVSRLHTPLERRRCRIEDREIREERDVWVDLSRGEVWEASPGSTNGNR